MIKTSPELQQRINNGENLRKIFARSRFRFFNSEGELLMEMTGHKMSHKDGGMSLNGHAAGTVTRHGILDTFRLDDYGANWIDGTCGHRYPADMLLSSTWGYENTVFTVDSFTLNSDPPAPPEPLDSGVLSAIAQKLFKWLR